MCGYVPGVHDVETVALAADSTAKQVNATNDIFLAVDTSIGTSVALSVAGKTFEAKSHDERAHTEVIGELIASVFAESGLAPNAVTTVVVGIGPGPFTGLRVGIAAAKAFATAHSLPMCGLPGHHAAALHHFRHHPGAQQLRVLQDAKRRELFVTEFTGVTIRGLPNETAPAHLLSREAYREEPYDVWPTHISAAHLCELAYLRKQAWLKCEPAQALYLRAPDVKPASAIKRVSTVG